MTARWTYTWKASARYRLSSNTPPTLCILYFKKKSLQHITPHTNFFFNHQYVICDHACLTGTHSQTRRCFRIIWCVQGSQVLSVSHSIQLLDLFFLMEGVTELPIRQIHLAELPIPLFKRFSPRYTSTLFNCARRQYSVIARDSCFVISLSKV